VTEAHRCEKLAHSFYAVCSAETQTHDLLIACPTLYHSATTPPNALVQRIFNFDKIEDTSLTPDNLLNIFTYGLPVYVIIHTSNILVNNGPVFSPLSIINLSV